MFYQNIYEISGTPRKISESAAPPAIAIISPTRTSPMPIKYIIIYERAKCLKFTLRGAKDMIMLRIKPTKGITNRILNQKNLAVLTV